MIKLITKLLLNLTVFFSIFIFIETIIYYLEIPHLSSYRTQLKYDLLANQVDENSILIVGDSRAEWNLKPEIIDSILQSNNLNYKCINLAMPGSNGTDILEKLSTQNKHPKLIIWGFSSFTFYWDGHKFEDSEINPLQISRNYKNLFYEKIQNNSYLLENNFNSISFYLKNEKHYVVSHKYDKKGGVYIAYETASSSSYTEREDFQVERYVSRMNNSTKEKYIKYKNKVDSLVNLFKDSSILLQIRFPISEKLKLVEYKMDSINNYQPITNLATLSYKKNEQNIQTMNFNLDKYNGNEESIFMDGSHFTHAVAEEYSIALANFLCKNLLESKKTPPPSK